MEDEFEKNKNKYISSIDNEYYNTEDEENENAIIENELLENEYFDESVYKIYSNIFEFINNKSLTICEFLSIKELENFIEQNL